MTNKTLIFKKIPTGLPVAGEHLVVEERPFDSDAAPPAGGLIVEILYASYDPYLRGRMRAPGTKSYMPAFDLDGPIYNHVIARVLKSASPDYSRGDFVKSYLPIAEYAVIEDLSKTTRIYNPHQLDLSLFLGPLGMPGLTAYSGLYKIGQPKANETIFISSAAGAVGQVVGQIAKREGLRVIGSVGSDEKLRFITEELGFDAGFNYKRERPKDALRRLAPQGIDIYFENVGGEHLEAALDAMNDNGRIPVCGMISEYNTPVEERFGMKNLMQIISKTITMQGFLVSKPGYRDVYAKEHQMMIQAWIAEGSVHFKIHVTQGIDNAAEGFIGMLQGQNFGKAVLKIKDEATTTWN